MRVDPRICFGRRPGPLTGRGPAVQRNQRGRADHGGAASLAGLLVLALVAGCGGAAAPATGLPSPSAAAATATATSAGAAAVPGATPARRLAAAFEPLRAGYSFDTVVTIGGQVAARVTGRRLAGASEMTIESGGTSVAYRMLPPRSFVRQADGTWVEADGQVPDADPLAALLAPLTITAVPGANAGLKVTYPAAALGLAGDQASTVFVRPAQDGTVSATWTATIAGREAVSTTLLGPAAGAPILDPTAP